MSVRWVKAGRCENSPGRDQSLTEGIDVTERTCSRDGCQRTYKARGFCWRHYEEARLAGDFVPHGRGVQGFWSNIAISVDGCWLWLRKPHRTTGYGEGTIDGKRVSPHRYMYEWAYGPIPDGLHIDHLCRNRICVRPDHMEAVTLVENVMRGYGITAMNARKTHCKRGHPLSGENLHVNPRGQRVCRSCRLTRDRGYKAANRVRRTP